MDISNLNPKATTLCSTCGKDIDFDRELDQCCYADRDKLEAIYKDATTGNFLSSMTDEQITSALLNIGCDTSCGACMGQFYTGSSFGNHTCEQGKS